MTYDMKCDWCKKNIEEPEVMGYVLLKLKRSDKEEYLYHLCLRCSDEVEGLLDQTGPVK